MAVIRSALGPPSAPGMRAAVVCLILAFATLFILNALVSSPESQKQAVKYFSPEVIERGLQYSQEARLVSWCGIGFQLALLTALVCTSWARRLADWCDRLSGHRWLLTLLMVAAVYFVLSNLLALPIGLVRLEQARAWHMTDRSLGGWLVDWAKGLMLAAGQGAVVLLGLYGLMYFFPRWWWLLAATAGTALGILYAFLMPEIIQPLFNTFTALDDPYLRERVRILASKADLPVADILVMDASTRSRHTNAYFIGFGSTRRIVLYDTLLQSHSGIDPASCASDLELMASAFGAGPMLAASQAAAARYQGYDEIETILAHEMGHWQHHHIVKGIALAAMAGLVGLFLLSRILRWAVGRRPFLLTSPTDPAGLPLILLLLTLAMWVTMPIQNGISRYFERQADETALQLTQKPEAFIAAEKRLALDNLSNVAPTPFNVWMFSTHPPTVDRIEMAEEWHKEAARERLR
jgi:STE24 endopeptidase